MEAVDSIKTLVYFHRIILLCVSEDNTLHSHESESFKYVEMFNYNLFTVEEYFNWILIFHKPWRKQRLHCPTHEELLCYVSKVCHSYTTEIMYRAYIVDNIRLTTLTALTHLQINFTPLIFQSNGHLYTQLYFLLYRVGHKSHTTDLKFIVVECILICL